MFEEMPYYAADIKILNHIIFDGVMVVYRGKGKLLLRCEKACVKSGIR